MGDIARMINYERNTELDQEDILENCLKRAYGKDTKAQLLDKLVEKITEEIWQCSDDERGDNEVFYWVINYGNKKEIDHIDERLCDPKSPLCIDSNEYEAYLDYLPKFKAKLGRE
tara:strand:+ start:298 stop:642 length:345 start_codon:yes stop_codon:yes gene_type:complete